MFLLSGDALGGELPTGQRDGKGEGGQAVFTRDGDVLLMLIENGFDHVEPEPHAVLILGAGLIALVEALKEQRDLLGGNGVALVAHGNKRIAV